MAVILSSCGKNNTETTGGGATTQNTFAPTHWQTDESENNSANENIEYVSLSDIYDITFEGVSPNLSIVYTAKVTKLPIWDGQRGDNFSQKQVAFLVEGEKYDEKAKSDGSPY
jgi:hypothetical protein